MRPRICTYLRTISRIRVICACALRANWAITYAHCCIRARVYGALSQMREIGLSENGKRDNFATGFKTTIKYIIKIIGLSNRSLCAPSTRTRFASAENLSTFKRCFGPPRVARVEISKRRLPLSQPCPNSGTSSYLKFIASTMRHAISLLTQL